MSEVIEQHSVDLIQCAVDELLELEAGKQL